LTVEELERRTALWFTADDQDQPEIALEPGGRRTGAVYAFLRDRGGVVATSASYWDPAAERDVP
jgi:hypothetical protein